MSSTCVQNAFQPSKGCEKGFKRPKNQAKPSRYVVPDSLKNEVLKGVHNDSGHHSQFRSLSLSRQRFFWSNLNRDIRYYVYQCQRCIISKTVEPEGRAPLETVTSTKPLELVCIDFWLAEESRNKLINVLVITDHFTRMA